MRFRAGTELGEVLSTCRVHACLVRGHAWAGISHCSLCPQDQYSAADRRIVHVCGLLVANPSRSTGHGGNVNKTTADFALLRRMLWVLDDGLHDGLHGSEVLTLYPPVSILEAFLWTRVREPPRLKMVYIVNLTREIVHPKWRVHHSLYTAVSISGLCATTFSDHLSMLRHWAVAGPGKIHLFGI